MQNQTAESNSKKLENEKNHIETNQQEQVSDFLNQNTSLQAKLQKQRQYSKKQKLHTASKVVKITFLILFITLSVLIYHYLGLQQNDQLTTVVEIQKKIQPVKQSNTGSTQGESKNKGQIRPPPKPVQKRSLIPRNVWSFQYKNVDYQQSYRYRNIKYFSTQNNFQFRMVNLQNYKYFIQNSQLQTFIQHFKSYPMQRQYQQVYLQLLILLSIIESNGGIAIGNDLIIRGQLQWLMQLSKNNQRMDTFLYFNVSDKKSVQSNFINYFIASVNQNRVIKQMIERYKYFLHEVMQKFQKPKKNNKNKKKDNNQQEKKDQNLQFKLPSLDIVKTEIDKGYNQIFNQIIDANREILRKINQQNYDVFDYSDIYALQIQNYGNMHLSPIIDILQDKKVQYLQSYSEEYLQQMIGPISKIVYLPQQKYSQFLNNQKKRTNHQIVKNSFFQHNFLFHSSMFTPLREKQDTQTKTKWTIPRIIWVYLSQTQQKSPIKQYLIKNIISNTKQQSYQIIVFTKKNINLLLTAQQRKRIQTSVNSLSGTDNRPEIQRHLIKLNILSKYGGLFIDFGYFLLQNTQWLTNIAQNKFVFNKAPNHPQLLMFHKHQDHSLILRTNQTSLYWSDNLNYQTFFIASTKNNFTKQWLNQLYNQIQLKHLKSQLQTKWYLQSECEMKQPEIGNFIQNSLKCIINKKTKQINKFTGQQPDLLEGYKHYKIWSINSLFAGEKMNIASNKKQQKCYAYDYSKKQFQTKYGNLGYLSEVVIDGSLTDLKQKIAKMKQDSIFYNVFKNDQIQNTLVLQKFSDAYIKKVIEKLNFTK